MKQKKSLTKTQYEECFNKARGGVIFIDEAYSLGNDEGKDSFSKECIDTININLTEHDFTLQVWSRVHQFGR